MTFIHREVSPPSPTVQAVIDWHWTRRKPSSSRVATVERRRILKLFADLYGQRTADSLTGDDLYAFLDSRPRVKAAWTRKRWASTVAHPFALAEDLGLIGRNPFKKLKFRQGRNGRDLTEEEFRAMLRVATPPFRRVLVFCRMTGARPGEMSAMKWPDIRLEARAIILLDHKTADTQAEPKPRRIPFTATVVKLLKFLRRTSVSDYVFVNSFGGPWNTHALCRNVDRIRKKAGLSKSVKLYGTRHSFGTGAILSGLDIATLAELMGHNSTNTTERYVHLSGKNDHLSAAMDLAGRLRTKQASSW